MKIFTVGHSTQKSEELIELLTHYKIELLIDVRSMPRSTYNPQFNSEALELSLKNQGITYKHLERVGGLRSTSKASVNTGWKNPSFRGYADYMQTNEFKNGLNELIDLSKEKTAVIMCAEKLPWRCHRSLLSDALTVHGIEAFHIYDKNKVEKHSLTKFIKVDGTDITYPPEQEKLF